MAITLSRVLHVSPEGQEEGAVLGLCSLGVCCGVRCSSELASDEQGLAVSWQLTDEVEQPWTGQPQPGGALTCTA